MIPLLIIAYFLFHSFEGERGVLVWKTLSSDLAIAQKKHAALSQKQQALEQQIARLYSIKSYPDLKDEMIRRDLGHIGADEKIILYP